MSMNNNNIYMLPNTVTTFILKQQYLLYEKGGKYC